MYLCQLAYTAQTHEPRYERYKTIVCGEKVQGCTSDWCHEYRPTAPVYGLCMFYRKYLGLAYKLKLGAWFVEPSSSLLRACLSLRATERPDSLQHIVDLYFDVEVSDERHSFKLYLPTCLKRPSRAGLASLRACQKNKKQREAQLGQEVRRVQQLHFMRGEIEPSSKSI